MSAADDALDAASRSLSATMRIVAARFTRRGSAAVNVMGGYDERTVRAGTPTGEWGWTPINAWELDNNGRHPGNAHGAPGAWYNENDKKHGGAVGLITENTEIEGADACADAFGDAFIGAIFG